MSSYEIHTFSKDLPFIFHKDHLRKAGNDKCISNWHENLELIYCIEGKGTAVINSELVPIEKGSVLLINSGDIHYIRTETEEIIYYCVIISADFLREYDINVEGYCFRENVTDQRGVDFFRNMIKELEKKENFYHVIVRAECASYVAYLCRNYGYGEKENYANNRIKRGMSYIREHFAEDLKVEEIADYAGFSRFYFSRQFKCITGMTVMKYVELLRCRYGKELLEEGTSVTKAALECGFSDVSYFTKVFKKQYGMLPSECKAGRFRSK